MEQNGREQIKANFEAAPNQEAVSYETLGSVEQEPQLNNFQNRPTPKVLNQKQPTKPTNPINDNPVKNVMSNQNLVDDNQDEADFIDASRDLLNDLRLKPAQKYDRYQEISRKYKENRYGYKNN